ncbi:MAG: hypothetical protein CL908_18300 [Deltaproteobacteria bacterium]|nr:hypothetical protein [Deltaproteobacteria bacterium]
MSDTLTIFIDGLPFDELHKMPFSNGFASKSRMVPSLGYSVNCQTELFTGKKPDEIGFWCDWTYQPEHSPFKRWEAALALLSIPERIYLAKRVIHRLIDRFAPTSSTKNIPLRYLPFFAETGHSVFSPAFTHPSLLDHPRMKKFLHHHFPNTDELDQEIFEAAKGYIEDSGSPGHVLLTLVKLDHCSHWEGVGSALYVEKLLENDRYIEELSHAFLDRAPDGRVFVVSDHGMSNIDTFIQVDLEGNFGRSSQKTYVYFTEATLLRVWVESKDLQRVIAKYLDGIDGLERLCEDERATQGLTQREFGDLIYHTPVGTQIVPSFWGPKPSVGMHGHHSRYPEQHGICLSNRPGDFGEEVRAGDFYRCLSTALGE